jgi:hypothetical protein
MATKMEMQQMMEMLLKEIRAGQEQKEARRKRMTKWRPEGRE